MTAYDIDIELPPLPEWMSRFQIPADNLEDSDFSWLDCRMKDYARANVARNTALLQVEIEAARVERDTLLDALRQITEWPDGGNLYGQEKIKRFAQQAIDAAMQETKP